MPVNQKGFLKYDIVNVNITLTIHLNFIFA